MQLCLNEKITNPICINCLEQELISWARDRDYTLVRKIKLLKKEFDVFEKTSTKCLRCGNKMSTCSSSFLLEAMELIKDDKLKYLFKKSFISF